MLQMSKFSDLFSLFQPILQVISKILQILGLQPRSLEHFYLTVGQNNFGNKIPYIENVNHKSFLLYNGGFD